MVSQHGCGSWSVVMIQVRMISSKFEICVRATVVICKIIYILDNSIYRLYRSSVESYAYIK
jgi:hypothetical protein